MLAAAAICACSASHANAPVPETWLENSSGTASYYADRFAGKRTANGELYDPEAFTAAHRSLPFGTHVRVTDMASGRSVIVRVNDRGPWSNGRVIDISRAAARALDLIRRGHGQVQLVPANAGGIDDPAD